MTRATGLQYADGRPIQARDIARVRVRANLSQGPYGGWNSYAYDGAIPISPDMPGWLPSVRSADSNVNFDWMRLVSRARDLVRNDGWAKGAINRLLDSVVGAEFFPIPKPNLGALQRRFGPKFDPTWLLEFTKAVRAEYHLWADDDRFFADATRTQTVTQIFRTGLRHKLVDGDNVLMPLWDPAALEQGAHYATCLQGVEPERLCNPQWQIDTAERRGGVQIDALQAPVGYHIQQGHSFDWFSPSKSVTWNYFPRFSAHGRSLVVHDFDREMYHQHRGVGILAAALARLQKLNRYDDASLMAALLRATMGLFVTSTRDEAEVTDSLNPLQIGPDGVPAPDTQFGQAWNYYTQTAANTMAGVRMPIMPPGDKIQTVTGGGQTDDYEAINRVGHRYFAAVTGQGTPEISNDFSQLNYSSFRGEMLQAYRTMIRRRYDFARGTATPVYVCLLEEIVERWPEIMPAGFTNDDFVEGRSALGAVKWIGPGRGWIDPVKERQGEVLGLDAGFGTLEDTCAEVEGEWWLDRLDQRQMETQEMTKRGLKLPDWAGSNPASQVGAKPQPV